MHMFLYLLWIFRKLLVFISAIAHVYLKTSMCSHSNRFCVRLCRYEKLFFALMFIYILSVFDFLFVFFLLQPTITGEIQSPMGVASVDFIDPREPVAVSILNLNLHHFSSFLCNW